MGWGFHLQSPAFVTLLAYLLFGMGLTLSGVLVLGSRLAGAGDSLASRAGYSGSFFTGALAAVVATPCTAPFMATALGYALTQPAPMALVIFEALGLGLAFPYLAIALVPAWARLLPRPGPWMERLKQFLAFPLYGSAAWLLWVLSQQRPPRPEVPRVPVRPGNPSRPPAWRSCAAATSRSSCTSPRPGASRAS